MKKKLELQEPTTEEPSVAEDEKKVSRDTPDQDPQDPQDSGGRSESPESTEPVDEAAASAPRTPPIVDVPADGEADAGEAPEEEEPPKRGRLSRLRFTKKKDMPGGLWLKCENCTEVIYRKVLEEKGRVCPACGFHFTLPGRARIQMILDEGTWDERFTELTTLDRLEFVDKIPYSEKVAKTVERTGQNEALLCGRGEIEGRGIVLAVLDFSFMGGSMGEVVGEKIALAADLARKESVPLVIFTSSGGARMHEGVLSLMQMAKTCAALTELGESGGYSICVLTHPTTGGVTASFATVCDVTLAEPGALIGFAGPRVIATTLKQELPAGFQRAEFLLEKGMIDGIVKRSEMRKTLVQLLDYGSGPIVDA